MLWRGWMGTSAERSRVCQRPTVEKRETRVRTKASKKPAQPTLANAATTSAQFWASQ